MYTNFAALTDEHLTVWKRDVWRWARNRSFINKFMGKSNDSMIQHITELKKSEKGARAVITLVADLQGDGVAGDRTLEGNEEAILSYDQVILVDQLRSATRSQGRISEQKSVVSFRENCRNVLGYWLSDRFDRMAFLTLSGLDYSWHTNGTRNLNSDLKKLEFSANVSAPTANRHLRWDATTKSLLPGDTSSVSAADTPVWAMIVEAKAYAKNQYIREIRGEAGMEMYHCFMDPSGFAKLKLDRNFLDAWQKAMPRSKNNPLFKGMTDGIMVDGIMFHEFRHVFSTAGATAGNKWGTAGDVDGQRVLLCGSQALGFADIGMPTWEEEMFDYKNQLGVSVGKMCGMKKPFFRSNSTQTVEDFGVLCIDTAI